MGRAATSNPRRSRPSPLTSPAGTVVQLFDRALRIVDAGVLSNFDLDLAMGNLVAQ